MSATLRAYLARYPGVSVERLALATGLDPAQLGDPDALLDQDHWFAFVEAAARETGDASIAVGFAQQIALAHRDRVPARLLRAQRILARVPSLDRRDRDRVPRYPN